VLVAASMDRGVDLPGSLCRVQVICKMPMASLGSRQVSERLRQPGGELWYLANCVRSLMQMTGRAVRGMDDEAVCYVLDAHFGKVLKDGKRMGLWPEWWLEGLEMGRVREFL
jgi:Rad3-related DNA helicase